MNITHSTKITSLTSIDFNLEFMSNWLTSCLVCMQHLKSKQEDEQFIYEVIDLESACRIDITKGAKGKGIAINYTVIK